MLGGALLAGRRRPDGSDGWSHGITSPAGPAPTPIAFDPTPESLALRRAGREVRPFGGGAPWNPERASQPV